MMLNLLGFFFLFILTGEDSRIPVKVTAMNKVKVLKEKVKEEKSLEFDEQDLFYNNVKMEEKPSK